ncbi:MAG TPA: hypothetical protein VG649_10240 [Candidatus Angelobacter sp.]|jgi:hypothetical protein|nr:hypothetical protein [Candidatus Angelobacter sp.]
MKETVLSKLSLLWKVEEDVAVVAVVQDLCQEVLVADVEDDDVV